MVISRILQREGLGVCTPPDGREGVTLDRERGPDRILRDLEMPVMDAFGAAPRTHDAPIVSYASSEEVRSHEQAVDDSIAMVASQAVDDSIAMVASNAASQEDLLAALQAYLSAVETVSRHQEPLRIG